MNCLFVSDLHGKPDKYEKLFVKIREELPHVLFLGGDLLPHTFSDRNFIKDFLIPKLNQLKNELGIQYPKIFLILGNDDARIGEREIIKYSNAGFWNYINNKKVSLENFTIYGYCYTPPSPFLLKDWEKYDISRYVDPGCISPEEGKRTIEISERDKKYGTIQVDLSHLTNEDDLTDSIILFHGPPYNTNLDRVELAGKFIDHVPLDPHVGSIAIRKLIESKQPLLTLHGHIHESSRLTGSWKDKIRNTHCFSAAYDGLELAIIKFDTENLETAERVLI